MRAYSWLFAALFCAIATTNSAPSVANESDWTSVIRGLDLVVPDGRTAVFDLTLEDTEGRVLARAEAMVDAHLKLFRYLEPLRYRDDLLVVDGHLLFLDEAHGAERPRAVAFRDIQDKPLFYILAGTFLDLLETHEISTVEDGGDGTTRLKLEETGGHIIFENVIVTVWTEGETRRASRASLHDREDDIYWETAYRYDSPPLGEAAGLVIPSEISISLDDGDIKETYRLRISNFRVGPGGQISHGAIHGIE